jgi:hypothetical protein
MRRRSVLIVALAIVSLTTAGCASRNGGGTAPAGVMPALGLPGPSAAVEDSAKLNISGTYQGSAKWVEGDKEYSASLTIDVAQEGSKFSGSFTLRSGSKTDDLTIDGALKSDKTKKAKLAFTIYAKKARYATGSGTASKKKFAGKATVPASGSKPAVHITFSTTKKS